jgi:hypothetical protein
LKIAQLNTQKLKSQTDEYPSDCLTLGVRNKKKEEKLLLLKMLSRHLLRSLSTKSRPPLLGKYNVIYRDLFRVNATEKVILRDFESQKKLDRSSYDLVLKEDGLVHPSPSTGNFEGPNGASVRPNSPFMQEVIRGFKGKGVVIYLLKEGTPLPPELVLLHEHTDHHSIQCTQPMKLSELNERITKFCKANGVKMSKAEFVERYPFDSCEV